MVSVDSDRVSRAPPYSGTGFESRSFSFTRLSRSMEPLPRGLQLTTGLVTLLLPALQPPLDRDPLGLGCCDFARHYFRNRGFFLFLQVLRWFTSLSLLISDYVFIRLYCGFTTVGFLIRLCSYTIYSVVKYRPHLRRFLPGCAALGGYEHCFLPNARRQWLIGVQHRAAFST